MKVERQRLPYLDSARGFVALSVVTWHCFTAIYNPGGQTPIFTSPFHFFIYGEADVMFFFIHSGFILAYSHPELSERISLNSYMNFGIRRFFRIYPLFIFILLFSYLLRQTIYPMGTVSYLSQHFSKFWNTAPKVAGVLEQAILVKRIPDNPYLRLMPQDWTLTIEILAYSVIPFFIFAADKLKAFSWLIMLILLKVFHFNTYLFEFFIGINLYTFRNQISVVWRKINPVFKWIIAAIAVVLYTVCFGFPNIFNADSKVFTPAIDRLMVDAGCLIFFIINLNVIVVQKIFSLRIFVKLGEICYGMYVNHFFLLVCFSNIVLENIRRLISGPEWLTILLYILFFQLLTIVFSLVTYHLIEKPFNKWGKWLGIYLSDRTSAKLKKPVLPVL